jgi:hypothetical protein
MSALERKKWLSAFLLRAALFDPSNAPHSTPGESKNDLHSTTRNSLSLPRYATTSSSQRGEEWRPMARFSALVSSTLAESL